MKFAITYEGYFAVLDYAAKTLSKEEDIILVGKKA